MSQETELRSESFTIDGIDINVLMAGDKVSKIHIALADGKKDKTCSAIAGAPLYDFFVKLLRGKASASELQLDFNRLTPFRKRVYMAAISIPYGKTATYRDVAEMIGGSSYSRAVGQALKNNPFPLLVPCHRVLPRGAGIANPGNFSSGKELKVRLLEIEARHTKH